MNKYMNIYIYIYIYICIYNCIYIYILCFGSIRRFIQFNDSSQLDDSTSLQVFSLEFDDSAAAPRALRRRATHARATHAQRFNALESN